MLRLRLPSSIERALPIALMGGLALLSFSLLKSTPQVTTHFAAPPQTSFDYYLQQFSTAQLNESGKLKSFIRGAYAEHTLADKNTRVQSFLFSSSSKNNLYLGHSDLADFKDDANELSLLENAVINRIPHKQNATTNPATLKSNHLELTQYPEKVKSLLPVVIEQGNRTIFAKSMLYDGDTQQINLFGNVKIKNEPKRN